MHLTGNTIDCWLVRLLAAGIVVGANMLALASAAQVAAGDQTQLQQIEVAVRDGRLTLQASNALIDEVIRSIGAQAGFETVTYGAPKIRINRSISEMPLVMAVRQLLKGVSNSMHFEEGPSPRLIQISLYATSELDNQIETPHVETGTVMTRGLNSARIDEFEALHSRAATGDAEAVMQLAALLLDDSDPAVRARAAVILGEIGDAAAVAVLETGTQDVEQFVRIRSIRALATIRNDQSSQVLADLLFNHSDSRTRLLAVWALKQQATPLARSYLESARDKADALVQSAITRALESGSNDQEL